MTTLRSNIRLWTYAADFWGILMLSRPSKNAKAQLRCIRVFGIPDFLMAPLVTGGMLARILFKNHSSFSHFFLSQKLHGHHALLHLEEPVQDDAS